LINRIPLSEHEFQHYSWREYGIRYSHFLDNALKVKYAASMA